MLPLSMKGLCYSAANIVKISKQTEEMPKITPASFRRRTAGEGKVL